MKRYKVVTTPELEKDVKSRESVGDSHQLTHFSIPLSTLNIRDSETYLAAVLTSLSAQ